jgi:S1-C subfamily serine protease
MFILRRRVSVLAQTLGVLLAYAVPASADSSGSGFFINPVWVMTNKHVVEGCERVEVPGYGTVQDILRDPGSDLAVVRVVRSFSGKALSFRNTRSRLTMRVPA